MRIWLGALVLITCSGCPSSNAPVPPSFRADPPELVLTNGDTDQIEFRATTGRHSIAPHFWLIEAQINGGDCSAVAEVFDAAIVRGTADADRPGEQTTCRVTQAFEPHEPGRLDLAVEFKCLQTGTAHVDATLALVENEASEVTTTAMVRCVAGVSDRDAGPSSAFDTGTSGAADAGAASGNSCLMNTSEVWRRPAPGSAEIDICGQSEDAQGVAGCAVLRQEDCQSSEWRDFRFLRLPDASVVVQTTDVFEVTAASGGRIVSSMRVVDIPAAQMVTLEFEFDDPFNTGRTGQGSVTFMHDTTGVTIVEYRDTRVD